MTRDEFDVWVAENYRELVYIATATYHLTNAEDVVGEAIARWLGTGLYARLSAGKNPKAFFMRAVGSVVANARRHDEYAKKYIKAERKKLSMSRDIYGRKKSPKARAE